MSLSKLGENSICAGKKILSHVGQRISLVFCLLLSTKKAGSLITDCQKISRVLETYNLQPTVDLTRTLLDSNVTLSNIHNFQNQTNRMDIIQALKSIIN